ncbi:hypothetical protein A3C18_00100 [Candidatus Kaiserbacteria bacterium RIFCSPHIGHO2_02_FULL_54_11b]|uniref:ABC transmembrane type-1 domain-containing protein n=2 Tax=Candidatus Kaiseribacteriota TaxID=1752734 RepID=A0A1F6CRI1_9BACT|nr:MAG: hypothetical protein A2704_07050 [Candidatus Kaiserbacteria bacterium RIFCSPHIGHO2_01_FULL_54_36b]OGG64679.1 MAG: hypothetical protein A3C18_00100 [Candidatus Kaiserbacteria bacterium RIFCSPHIGHO2_02_FULL_54_11b]
MKDILDLKRHATPLRFFLAVNRKEIPLILLNIFFYSMGAVSLIVLSYFLGKAIDGLTNSPEIPLRTLMYLIVGSVVWYEVSYRIGHICEIFAKTRIRARTKKALFNHTRSLSFGYFADRFAGEIAHKIAMCADAFERLTLVLTNNVIEEIVLIATSIVVLGFINPWYAIFLLLWSLFLFLGLTGASSFSNSALSLDTIIKSSV